MTAKVVRLNLPSKLLAHIKTIELHRHLQGELAKLPYDLTLEHGDRVLNDLVFLLVSPLFLYSISPRLHSTTHSLREPSLNAPTKTELDASSLSFTVGHNDNSCFTQLRCGASVLIETRRSNQTCQNGCKKSLEWFCDEVEFLGYEYRAREDAAAESLGRELVHSTKSKIMRVKVSKQHLAALEKMENCGVKKEKKVKLKLRLWKNAVEG